MDTQVHFTLTTRIRFGSKTLERLRKPNQRNLCQVELGFFMLDY